MKNYITLKKIMAMLLAAGVCVTSIPAEAISAETVEPYDTELGTYEEYPVYEETYEEPYYEETYYEEPVYEEPVYQEPVYQEPVYEEPVYQEPVYEEPLYYGEETQTSFLYEDDVISVIATLQEWDGLPNGTTFTVRRISPDDPALFQDSEYLRLETEEQRKDRELYEWANERFLSSLEEQQLVTSVPYIYDLYFEKDGVRLKPAESFDVEIAFKTDSDLTRDVDTEHLKVFYLDDNDVEIDKIDAVDTDADFEVNEWGFLTKAWFSIGRYRYTPLIISKVETREEYEQRLADEAAVYDGNDNQEWTEEAWTEEVPVEEWTEEEWSEEWSEEAQTEELQSDYAQDEISWEPEPEAGLDDEIEVIETTPADESDVVNESDVESESESEIQMVTMEPEETTAAAEAEETTATAEAESVTETETTAGTEETTAAGTEETIESQTEETTAAEPTGEEATEEETAEEIPEENPEEISDEDDNEADQPSTRTYYATWGGDVSATIILSNPEQVPDTAEVVVTAITPDTDGAQYDAYMEALNSSSDTTDYTPENTLLYDIKFVDTIVDENGEARQIEYEPAEGSVRVILRFKQNQLRNEIKAEINENVEVNHLVVEQAAPEAVETGNSSDVTETADAAESADTAKTADTAGITEVTETTPISAADITVEPVEADVKLQGTDTVTFQTGSFSVYSFTTVVKQQVLEASDGNTYQIKVEFDSTSGIPENSELAVTELIEGTPEYTAYVEETAKTLGLVASQLSFAYPFDITLVDPETGDKYQPNKNVKVSVELLTEDLEAQDSVSVVHFKGDVYGEVPEEAENAENIYRESLQNGVEVLDAVVNENGAVEFETGSFSVYVIAGFTVDFHWGEYVYSIAGESEILLSDLLTTLATSVKETLPDDSEQLLSLTKDLSQVESVSFSDEELVKVEEKNGDWLLTSLKAFDTEETLTLTIRNGEEVEILVTDASTVNSGTWANGSSGSGTWSIDTDGVLTIAGSGQMKTYNGVSDTEWYDYINKNSGSSLFATKLVIENGITKIGQNSFTRAYYVEEIDARNCVTLTTLGESAFKQTEYSSGSPRNTSNPQRIDYSGCTSLKAIDKNAFSECKGIQYLDISNTQLSQSHLDSNTAGFGASKNALRTIKANNCTKITSLNLSGHGNLTTIELSNCINLNNNSLSLPNSVVTVNLGGCTKITSLDLSGKDKLKNLTLPNTLTTLNLTGCSGLESLDVHGFTSLASLTLTGVTSLQSLNVSGCTALTELTVPEGVTTLNVSGCTSLTELTVPTSVTRLYVSGCTSLTELTVPEGVTTLDVTDCSNLTSLTVKASVATLDLTGDTGLTYLWLPQSITGVTSLDACTNLTTIEFDGTKEEWRARGITVPSGVYVRCLRSPYESDILNDFVDSTSTYKVGADGEISAIDQPAILNSVNDEINLTLHFSEIPGAQGRQMIMPESSEAPNPILFYNLPVDNTQPVNNIEYVSLVSTATTTVSGYTFTGEVTKDGNQLKLEWSFANHTEEEITAFLACDNLEFDINLTVKVCDLLATIDFGSERNQLIFIADTPHNPKVDSKSSQPFNQDTSQITYEVEITAEGDVDNNGVEYPVVIQDTMGEALTFASGSFTYTHKAGFTLGDSQKSKIIGKTAIDGDKGTLQTDAGTQEFFGFPITVEHMYDGDTITFTYVANVDKSKITNGSPTDIEAKNTVKLSNTDSEDNKNPFNIITDDTKSYKPDILFPELSTKVVQVDDVNGFPVYEFTTYVSAITEDNLTNDEELVIENVLDSVSGNVALWKLCTAEPYAPTACGMEKQTDTEPQSFDDEDFNYTSENGQVAFTLSNLKQGRDDSYWNFYKVVYYITPEDANALNSLKQLAVEQDSDVGVHTFTSNTSVEGYDPASATYTYNYLPIQKTLTDIDGNWAYYRIVVNPDAMALPGGNTLTLTDTFYVDPWLNNAGVPNNPEYIELVKQYPNYTSQSIDYASIEVDNALVTYDYSGYVGTFQIPNGTRVTITYRTRIGGKSGTEVTFINDAVLSGVYTANLTTTRFIYPGGDDIEVKDENYIWLYKYENGHMESGLAGAQFILLNADQQPILDQRGSDIGREIIFTTTTAEENAELHKSGYVKICLTEAEHGLTLKKNTLYYLEEVVAPTKGEGDNKTYFKKDSTLYSFVISDNPYYDTGDDTIYTYFNGDVLKVRNYAESQGIFINKRFTGNYLLTDEQKANITFKLQKKITNSGAETDWEDVIVDGEPDVLHYMTLQMRENAEGAWQDVLDDQSIPEGYETRYKNNFPYGYAKFKTNTLAVGDTYQIVEEGAEIGEGIDLRSNWIVTQVSQSAQTVPVTGNSVEFTVKDSDLGHSIDVLCDNKYVQSKLVIKKVDAEDGKGLPGATFTIYNSSNQIVMTLPQTTDKGITEITKTNILKYDTLYYAIETTAPEEYMLLEEPQRIYFYFSNPDSEDPWKPSGVQAVDLTENYTTVTVPNRKSITNVPVLKVWNLDEGNVWPKEVDHVSIGLYRSTNGSEEVPVTDEDGIPRVVRLTEEACYSDEFSGLTALDSAGNRITYSIQEVGVYGDADETQDLTANYSPSYSVTDSGVYVVKNAPGTSIKVVKEWYDGSQEKITDPRRLANKEDVSFDIYRCIEEIDPTAEGNILTREEIENSLSQMELVKTGITLGNTDNWEKTIGSLEKLDSENVPYYYYALESKNKDLTDTYVVTNDTATGLRQLTIRNSGDMKPICKVDEEVFYTLNKAMTYIQEHDLQEATIEMLVDYVQPVSDALVIPNGYKITLTTASREDDTDPFKPDDDSERTEAILSRYTTFTDVPMITNRGELIVRGITLEGNNIQATRAMIESNGTKLTLGDKTVLQNAKSTGNGGAVCVLSGDVEIAGGSLTGNEANRGGAIFADISGRIEIKDNTILTQNKAYQGGAIYSSGAIITLSVAVRFEENEAVQGGNGGAIYASGGSITVKDGVLFQKNESGIGNGGAVYVDMGVVNVEGGTFKENKAYTNGGAIYSRSGAVNVSNGLFGGTKIEEGKVIPQSNTAGRNGGAIYAGSGTITLENGDFTYNIATENGGAIYLSSGTMNLSGGSIQYNTAKNGAAIFTGSGIAYFYDSSDAEPTHGVIKNNTASKGGAVGIGTENARLYFSGNIQISDNIMSSKIPSNVYLDQNTNTVIYSRGLGNESEIGVHVPDDLVTVTDENGTVTQVKLSDLRGVPGTTFGSYSLDTNYGKFKNDRFEVKAFIDASTQKLMWGKEIQVELRYLASYKNGFPPKNTNGEWAGTFKYSDPSYNPKISDGAISQLAEDLYSKAGLTSTAAFGAVYAVTGNTSDEDEFGDYLTHITWDSNRSDSNGATGAWKCTKRDGTEVYPTKIVIFYSEPAYISIENNTNIVQSVDSEDLKFTITSLMINNTRSAFNSKTECGYGYVVSKDGATRSSLLPLSNENDLVLAPGGSIKLMIPGGVKKDNKDTEGMTFTLQGRFAPYDATEEITVFHTSGSEGNYVQANPTPTQSDINNPGLSYKTLPDYGKTYEVIFESRKPVCKIIQDEEVLGLDILKTDAARDAKKKANNVLLYQPTGAGHEYLFSSIKDAVKFTKDNALEVDDKRNSAGKVSGAKIEILVDYLLPGTDLVSLDSGYQYTFVTARNENRSPFYYNGSNPRAVISRDSGNKNSLITFVGTKDDMSTSYLIISDLDFDGKNLAGNSDGGAIKTQNCAVEIENADFKNFIARNGGAVYVEYVDPDKKYDFTQDFLKDYYGFATLTATNVNFKNCVSNSTANRQGGGAIWTNAKVLTITGTEAKPCTFEGCIADDQGGAVFHRMDKYVAETTTTLQWCTIKGSEARAAGGVESDTSIVTVENCKFYNCTATQRNGGALNIYSNNSSNTNQQSKVKVEGCYFENCHADDGTGQACHGGGFRSAAIETKVINCIFNKCSSIRGGGMAMSNTQGGSITVIDGCTVNNCTSLYTTIDEPNKTINRDESGRGGGIYCMSKTLYIDYNAQSGTTNYYETGKETSVSDCTAGQEGGGIYHSGGTLFKAAGCTVTGCKAGTAGTAKRTGGGIHTPAANTELKNCTIRDNIALGSGGGIYQAQQNSNKSFVVDQTIVVGNVSGEKGGGIYTAAPLTLKNDSYIMSNQITGGDVEDSAGAYINNTTLTVGSAERYNAGILDASTIKDNYTAGGKPSDLRLRWDDNKQRNHEQSVVVKCGLSGEILVVNAAVKQSQFGKSDYDNPVGFTDLRHVFKADDGSLFGIVDRNNTKYLIWAGDPVCKITDGNGNILYFKDGNSAIFDSLDVEDANDNKTSKSSAFSILRNSQPDLYTDKEGTKKYTGNTYYIKMLVPEYTVNNYILIKNNAGREIYLTTAGTTDSDGYIFKGNAGEYAKIIQGSLGEDQNMITAKSNLTLQNIVVDGAGSNADSCIKVDNSSATVTLGRNAVIHNWTVNGNGGGVYVNSGSLVIDNGTIQNCNVSGNGGGVYVDANGELTIRNRSYIQNCTAENGGAVYTNGTSTLEGGTVTRCRATTEGGGVYVAASGALNMTGGSITFCGIGTNGNTQSGGGVFVADGSALSMSGGRIEYNRAMNHGGGIAVGGEDNTTASLTFSRSVYVRNNYLGTAQCNVELDQDSNTIINSAGLDESSLIGVYVTGDLGATENELGTGNFAEHGNKDQIFGTWTNSAYLKCFVNDRNNLRGGMHDEKDGDTNIYWIQIYFLRVSKQVVSIDPQEQGKDYEFNIQLTGTGLDIDGKMVAAADINGSYGEITFTEGEAIIELKNGESKQAENLPGGLQYTVTEMLEQDEQEKFTTIPEARDSDNNPYTEGIIGRKDGKTNYLSLAEFTNIHAVCKTTSDTRGLLYYRLGNNYEPAVYLHLSDAFKDINKSNSVPLYYKDGEIYRRYGYSGGYNVEMLVSDYTITDSGSSRPITLNFGYNVTLKTADKNATDGYRYSGGDSTAVIKRGYNGNSMISTLGNLTLGKIALDGQKNNEFSGNANGGLVKVGNNGKTGAVLTIGTGAELQNSTTTGNGAAVCVFSGNTMNISGKPEFSNNTVTMSGYFDKMNGTQMEYIGNNVHQDIYLVGSSGGNSASLVVTGDMTGNAGSIWVWSEDHYKEFAPFAKIASGQAVSSNSLKVFRNAQDDETTENTTGSYLYGMTLDGTNVIWNGTFVCKITNRQENESSNVLYTENGAPAVYSKLIDAFNTINDSSIALYKYGETSSYSGSVNIEMLVPEYTISNGEFTGLTNNTITLNSSRSVTLTTADRVEEDEFNGPGSPCEIERGYYGDSMITSQSDLTLESITLDGNKNDYSSSGNGGIIYATSGSLTIGADATLQNSKTDGDGGAVYSTNSASVEMTGGEISGCEAVNGGAIYHDGSADVPASGGNAAVIGCRISAGTISGNTATNGGAVYVASNATTEMTGGTISGNSATNGGAVYVVSEATMEMKDGTDANDTSTHGTINGNTATTAGAGIYLEQGSTLKLSGALNFGGTGTDASADISGPQPADAPTNGNYLTATVSEKTNGQKSYTTPRQDIFIAGYATEGSAAQSLVIAGPLGTTNGNTFTAMAPGSIWVWAQEAEHYKMLKQFAVFESETVKSSMTAAQLSGTLAAFRNAQTDDLTECGADYLTGQEGDDISGHKCIYWTGGFDFKFLKIDGNGEVVPDATFTLYQSETEEVNGVDVVSPSEDEDGNLILEPYKRNNANVTGKSANGTTDKDSDETTVLDMGIVLFTKVAPKTYYMVETTKPTKDKEGHDASYADNKLVYMVVMDSKGKVEIFESKYEVDGDITTTGNLSIKERTDAPAEDKEVFKVKTGTETVDGEEEDIFQYQIMNESDVKHQAILRKVKTTNYESLEGGQFHIFRVDLTEITEGQATYKQGDTIPPGKNAGDSKGYYESMSSGAYFIGELPEGKYYVLETVAPSKASSDNAGKVFIMNIDSTGVTQKVIGDDETNELLTKVTGNGDLIEALKTYLIEHSSTGSSGNNNGGAQGGNNGN